MKVHQRIGKCTCKYDFALNIDNKELDQDEQQSTYTFAFQNISKQNIHLTLSQLVKHILF